MATATQTTRKTPIRKTTPRKAAPKSKKEAGAQAGEASVYNVKGKEVGKVTLPEQVFNVSWNADLMHQVVVSQMANARANIAHIKGRGEVRGGGAKPWRQKGTGRARHGSIRSPIWEGGGVTFGPSKERNFKKKINKKMRKKALYSALSRKLKDGELLFVDDIHFESPSAKEAKQVLQNLSAVKGFETLLSKKRNSAVIGLSSKDMPTEKSFSNFGNINVAEWRNLNPVSVLSAKYLVITHPKEAVSFFEGRQSEKDSEVIR